LALQVAEVEKGRRERLEVGNLDVIRDFIDVRDVAQVYRLLGQKGEAGEIYNLGSDQGTKIAAALEYLRSQAKTTIPVHVDAARVRPVDQPLLVADSSKLRKAIGWEPAYTIEQTLSDMLDFSRNSRS
jgi:GDP-4-dehydro-6-deoxy-D-mannose reductase